MSANNYIFKEEAHNSNSPNCIAPILIKMFHPKSVLDVGCGIGNWLHEFRNNGISDIFGLDCDNVPLELLKQNIPIENFKNINLNKTFNLDRKFDLLTSLEVAEHLEESSADAFIQSLVLHSDTIIFSAALPGQGGQNHINEQWKEFWIKKFKKHKYNAFDILRPLIWNNKNVDYWYKQNILVFSNMDLNPLKSNKNIILDTIHPELLEVNKNHIIYLENYIKELETKLYT